MSSTEVLHKQPVAEYMDLFKIWETAGLSGRYLKTCISVMGLNKDLVQAGKNKMFVLRKQNKMRFPP